MKRKWTVGILLVLTGALATSGLGGCGKKYKSEMVAVITDGGDVTEEGVNKRLWEGARSFIQGSGMTAQYYCPETQDTEGYEMAIQKAADDGASVVLCAGEEFSEAVGTMQRKDKAVQFLLLEAEPTRDGKEYYRGNTASISMADEQAGFLAGYAAVMEGYVNLGFLGGAKTEDAIVYESGFLQGADRAAAELGYASNQVTVRCRFLGTDGISPAWQQEILGWYDEGVQVIYTCGNGAESMARNAASQKGGKIITDDMNEDEITGVELSGAGMDYSQAVCTALKLYQEGKLKRGSINIINASNNGIGLKWIEGQFVNFTYEAYQNLEAGLADGSIKVSKDDVTKDLEKYEITHCMVTFVE